MASSSPAPIGSAHYPISEIARFCNRHSATVRKWFIDLPGVFRLPRGPRQQPSLEVRESTVRKKLTELGFPAEMIDDFVRQHDARFAERQERHQAAGQKRRQAKAATPRAKRRAAAPPKKGGRRVARKS